MVQISEEERAIGRRGTGGRATADRGFREGLMSPERQLSPYAKNQETLLTPELLEQTWSKQHRGGRSDRDTETEITLWNFDVASTALKPEHEAALQKFLDIEWFSRGIRQELHQTRYVVIGRASLTGAEQFNTTLASLRAETVASYMSSRFGIARTRIETIAGKNSQQRGLEPYREAGEWFAYNRQVQLKSVVIPPRKPPNLIDEPAPKEPEKPLSKGTTLISGISFDIQPIRIPPKGVFKIHGLLTVFITVSGKAEFKLDLPDGYAGPKLSFSKDKMVKLTGDVKKRLNDNLKLEFNYGFVKDVNKPIPFKTDLSFKEFGPLSDVKIGFDFSELKLDGAPTRFVKTFKEPFRFRVYGQDVIVEAKIDVTVNVGLTPKAINAIGTFAKRAVQGATVTEGAVVTTGIAGPVVVGVGAVMIFLACTVGMAKTVEWAKEEGLKRALVVAFRNGFALAVSYISIGPTPETNRYYKIVLEEYKHLPQESNQAFHAGIKKAKSKISGLEEKEQKKFKDGVLEKYGGQIEQSHNAIFQALGGISKKDLNAGIDLTEIPVESKQIKKEADIPIRK